MRFSGRCRSKSYRRENGPTDELSELTLGLPFLHTICRTSLIRLILVFSCFFFFLVFFRSSEAPFVAKFVSILERKVWGVLEVWEV